MLTPLSPSAPRPRAGDLVELLTDCHRKIRRFLAVARHLADAEAVTDDEAREAAVAIQRYFTLALPLHVRDEEESIVPRLRGRRPEVDAALGEMESEHRQHAAPLAQLSTLCATIALEPRRRLESRAALATVVAALEEEMSRHLLREESLVFPAIAELLDPASQAAILGELRARREPR